MVSAETSFFSIKQVKKSRLNTVISFAPLTTIQQSKIEIKYLGLIHFLVSGIHISQNDLISRSKSLTRTKYKIGNQYSNYALLLEPVRNPVHSLL